MDIKKIETNHVGETILKKYDDKPLYDKSNPQTETGYTDRPKVPWAHDVIHKAKTHISAHPSPLMVWQQKESRKSRLGLMNEIDINEIKAAAGGVKNKWYDRVMKNIDIVNPMITFQKFDWQKLKELA